MLHRLELENVGPAPRMALNLAPRLNLITGDNGLGKSFLLDVAWWALTRKWPRDLNPRLTSGYAARPTDVGKPAKLRFTVKTATGHRRNYESEYSALDEGLARAAWSALERRTRHTRSCRRRIFRLGSGQKLLEEEGEHRRPGPASRLHLFFRGTLDRANRPGSRKIDQGLQGTSRRLVKLDSGTRRKRGSYG